MGTGQAEARPEPESLASGTPDAVREPEGAASVLSHQMRQLPRESEARHCRLMQRVSAIIFELEADGTVVFVNDAVARVTRYCPEDLIGWNWWDVFFPGEKRRQVDDLYTRLRKGDVGAYAISLVSRDGTNIVLELDTANHYAADGALESIVGFATHRTARQQAEEALRRTHEDLEQRVELRTQELAEAGRALSSEIAHREQLLHERERLLQELDAERERLAVTLRAIGDGVIVADANGRVSLMNKVAEALTGYSESEALGQPLTTIFRITEEKTGEERQAPIARVLTEGHVLLLDSHLALVAKDGSRHLISDSVARIPDADGRSIGVVLVFQDVTERHKLEEEVLKANKLEALGLLAGGIAHDFNNLLTAILGNVILAKMETGAEGGELAEVLGEAERASIRARDLTQQLLTFARGGAPVKKVAALRDLLIESCKSVLRGSGSTCRFDIAEDLWPVQADAGQMAQVVQNLVVNADEAMPAGGRITVRAHNRVVVVGESLPLAPGPYVEVVVEDERVGIQEQHMNRIFDPYFTTKQKGSGIGLSVCYSIVNKHDGFIAVESQVGVGSKFHLYLPAAGARVQETTAVAVGSAGRQRRALVMDDEEVVLRVARRMLERLGYQVDVARDGTEAVELYRRARGAGQPFDVVVLDLVVPGGLGGKETVCRLREVDPKVKAVVSSGYSNDPVVGQYAKYGFQGAIAKPYNLSELQAALGRILAEEPALSAHERP